MGVKEETYWNIIKEKSKKEVEKYIKEIEEKYKKYPNKYKLKFLYANYWMYLRELRKEKKEKKRVSQKFTKRILKIIEENDLWEFLKENKDRYYEIWNLLQSEGIVKD
jgi:molecular chaperone GrpE (heat shock protein)